MTITPAQLEVGQAIRVASDVTTGEVICEGRVLRVKHRPGGYATVLLHESDNVERLRHLTPRYHITTKEAPDA